jgi:hypothetical protein
VKERFCLPIWCSELLSEHALHVGVLGSKFFGARIATRVARNLATICRNVYMPPSFSRHHSNEQAKLLLNGYEGSADGTVGRAIAFSSCL